MKKISLIFVLLFGMMAGLFAQCGFVAVAYDDGTTRSAASVGQMFTLGVSVDGNYANEGLQQPFLYRASDTLLYENSSYPVAYRPAERIPQGNPLTVEVGETPVYLLPTQGLDSLISVMAYGITVNDTTVVAPYNVCEHNFTLQLPLVLPAGSVPPVQYYNNKPATYPVGNVTPVDWHFAVADKTLDHTQQVNVKFPPCGNDNYSTDIANYPYSTTLPNPLVAIDYEDHTYSTVRIDCRCWTAENLKSTKYFDGASIPNPMAYVSAEHPDSAANVERYGYLYTWDDAVRAPLAPEATEVRGVCPDGWHLPTEADFARLANHSAFELMSTTDWLNGEGTNATGFTALPAGKFTDVRFENLLGETDFWTASTVSSSIARYCSLTYGCSELIHYDGNKANGKSVRCLKSN